MLVAPVLSVAELLRIANTTRIDPDLFLDVQSETLDAFFDGNAFATITEISIYKLEKNPRYLGAGRNLSTISYQELVDLMISLTLRLRASEELSQRSWMLPLWKAAGSDLGVLDRMGRYFCEDVLELCVRSGKIVFNEVRARSVLEGISPG